MSYPDFLGIGMKRAGTSWLYSQMSMHPQIWMSLIKEMHYFDSIDPKLNEKSRRYSIHLKRFIRGLCKWNSIEDATDRAGKMTKAEQLKWEMAYFTGAHNDAWYQNLFHQKFTKGLKAGEITPSYASLSPEIIARIFAMNNKMKIFMVVRNPVDAAWSGAVHFLRTRHNKSPQDASEADLKTWLSGEHNLSRTRLSQMLENWQNYTPEGQLLLLPYEGIKDAPNELLHLLFAFLEVNADFLPAQDMVEEKINAKGSFKMPQSIREFLNDLYKDDIQWVQENYPAIAERWV